MRVFIYKRTHKGDPDAGGRFGIEDCMGRLRNCSFDAVIGIGGIRPWTRDADIAALVNWIGIGPRRKPPKGRRGDVIVFSHFALFENKGREFAELAPALAECLLRTKSPRFLITDETNKSHRPKFAEIERILNLGRNYPPSSKETYPYWQNHQKCICRGKATRSPCAVCHHRASYDGQPASGSSHRRA